VQGENRSRIMGAANGDPPLDEETAKKLGVKINVNWQELLILLCHARIQLLNAFLGNQYFFTVKIPMAPPEHQAEWESAITEWINEPLQDSEEWFEVHNSRWSSVVAHGPALMFWPDEENWLPEFCPLADVRIATDTVRSFKNLNWIARRIMWTPMELLDEVFNDKPNNRWDKRAVASILKNYKEINFTDAGNNYDIETDPEKYVELVKQNGGYYGSDAVPAIPLYNFYFKDTDGWHMRVVPETGTVKGGAEQDKFLWPSNTENDPPMASTWKHFVHCQHGDLSIDAPFKFHTERGLGYTLLEPTFFTNLTRCRMLQHVHDNFNIWLRSTDNAEKARVQIQEFANLGVLKQGLSIVPQAERHQIIPQLLDMAFAQLKQLQGEASASYTQQADTGSDKEQTAFETRVKVEQVNAMLGGILTMTFKYEGYAHREICRRFCLANSADPDVKEFQDKWDAMGIPKQFRNIKYWRIEPVTPLGMGNPTIALAMAQQVMAVRPMLNPTAQEEALHDYLLVITKDWRKARRWAPIAKAPQESDAKREMVGYFAALMRGAKIPLSQSNLIDQCEALLPLYAGEVTKITQRNNMATQDEAIGLQAVSEYLGRAIKQLAQDQTQAQKVKQYEEIKARQDNLARALIQRGAAAAKKAAQQNGNGKHAEAMGNLMLKGMEGKQRMKLKEQEANQNMRLKEAEFQQESHLRNIEAAHDIQHERFKTLADAHNNRLRSLQHDDESRG
jgi:hypothetical protein